MSKVWFVTGAGRGLGAAIAARALASGNQVVAGVRRPSATPLSDASANAVLEVPLDVSDERQIERAVETTMQRFGRIDVLVNNAGRAVVGAFEECSAKDLSGLFEVNLFGLAAVTRAILPIMRVQRSGHIFNLSSMAAIAGFPGASAYCATKFAVEGLSESLAQEVAPLGIKVTIVQPGYFRTGLLSPTSTSYIGGSIEDYDVTAGETTRMSQAIDGQQPGDPDRLADELLELTAQAMPPLRWNIGIDSLGLARQVAEARLAELQMRAVSPLP